MADNGKIIRNGAEIQIDENGNVVARPADGQEFIVEDDARVGTLEAEEASTNDILFLKTNEDPLAVDPATGTVSLDHSASNWYDPIAATENITVEFTNVSGTGLQFTLRFSDADDGGPYTITWPASVVWDGGNAVTEIPESGDLEIFLLSPDGGTTWRARRGGRNFA